MTLDPQLDLAGEPGNDKQTMMYFVFVIKIRSKSVSRDNGKVIRKEMSKLFLRDNLASHQNVEKILIIDTDWGLNQQQKTWILITMKNIWRVYRTKYYYGSVNKANFHSVDICRFRKNQSCKKRSRRKAGSNFIFFQAAKLHMRI